MSNLRFWIFRVLVLAGAGFMLVTWFMPWWSAWVAEIEVDAVIIHPWALESRVPTEYGYLLLGAETAMPGWFAPFMFTYLGLCIAALLFSLFASQKRVGLGKFRLSLPQAIIGSVGLSYIVIVAAAVITIAMRAGDFYDAPLIGRIYVVAEFFESTVVKTNLLFGYWLACAVGPLLIILAILRNKIIGKPKLIA